MPEDRNEPMMQSIFREKPKIREEWLREQRNRLMGAIDLKESQPVIRYSMNRIITDMVESPWWKLAASVVILLIGIGIGYQVKDVQANTIDKNLISIEDLLSSDQILSIQLDVADDQPNPFRFKLSTHDNLQYSGAEDDKTVLMLLNYMLNNTKNPGERLKLARKLTTTKMDGELAAAVITKAILAEDNSAIQMILMESVRNNQSSIVRDALLRIVLGDYDNYIRLSAMKHLEMFLDDDHVRQILKIVSLSDGNPSIRFTAGKLLLNSKPSDTNQSGVIEK